MFVRKNLKVNGLKILSCGAGMQSTSLALMSCENALNGICHPHVPIYDAIIFCDTMCEPPWVYNQVSFIEKACKNAGIKFVVLKTDLYGHYMNNFGYKSVRSIPFWSLSPEGKKGKMKRACTLDFKILEIQRYIKFNLIGYDYTKKNARNKIEDIGAHEMHIGFSQEESQRVFNSYNPFYINKFPLIDMGFQRADSFKYNYEVWGLETKASACAICPFHRNYFFQHLKSNHPDTYKKVILFDELIEKNQVLTPIKSKIFISRSRKRIHELTPIECNDAECFVYRNELKWNGF